MLDNVTSTSCDGQEITAEKIKEAFILMAKKHKVSTRQELIEACKKDPHAYNTYVMQENINLMMSSLTFVA